MGFLTMSVFRKHVNIEMNCLLSIKPKSRLVHRTQSIRAALCVQCALACFQNHANESCAALLACVYLCMCACVGEHILAMACFQNHANGSACVYLCMCACVGWHILLGVCSKCVCELVVHGANLASWLFVGQRMRAPVFTCACVHVLVSIFS